MLLHRQVVISGLLEAGILQESYVQIAGCSGTITFPRPKSTRQLEGQLLRISLSIRKPGVQFDVKILIGEVGTVFEMEHEVIGGFGFGDAKLEVCGVWIRPAGFGQLHLFFVDDGWSAGRANTGEQEEKGEDSHDNF